jgi:hypothetical protein
MAPDERPVSSYLIRSLRPDDLTRLAQAIPSTRVVTRRPR